jgi:TM2 domain-containing membrane protein YozV
MDNEYLQEKLAVQAAEHRRVVMLWFFFGLFGGHRFYLGQKCMGFTILSLTVASIILLLVWILALGATTGAGIGVLIFALGLLCIAGMIWLADFIGLDTLIQSWQEKKDTTDVEDGTYKALLKKKKEAYRNQKAATVRKAQKEAYSITTNTPLPSQANYGQQHKPKKKDKNVRFSKMSLSSPSSAPPLPQTGTAISALNYS